MGCSLKVRNFDPQPSLTCFRRFSCHLAPPIGATDHHLAIWPRIAAGPRRPGRSGGPGPEAAPWSLRLRRGGEWGRVGCRLGRKRRGWEKNGKPSRPFDMEPGRDPVLLFLKMNTITNPFFFLVPSCDAPDPF